MLEVIQKPSISRIFLHVRTEFRILSFEIYLPMISTSFLRVPYASQLVVWKRTQIKYWIVIVSIDVDAMGNGRFTANCATYNDENDLIQQNQFNSTTQMSSKRYAASKLNERTAECVK